MTNKKSTDNWQIADEEVRNNLPSGVKLVRTLRGHTDWIGRISWSPDGRLLASPSGDKTIRLWNIETGKCLRKLKGHQEEITIVVFDHKGLCLASGGGNEKLLLETKDELCEIYIWCAHSGKILRQFGGYESPISALAFDPTDKILACASYNSNVDLWDVETGACLRILNGHEDAVFSLVFDQTGKTLASADGRGEIRLWDADSGELLRTIDGQHGWATNIAFDSSGRMLASGGHDMKIKLWEVTTGRLLRTLEGHTDAVLYVGFVQETGLLVSKGRELDSTVRFWHIETGRCVATISEPSMDAWMPGVAIHPNIPLIATVGSDPGAYEKHNYHYKTSSLNRLIHLWELDSLALLDQATTTPTVAYTSAKVVLVGESNVGKSYLAHRVATGLPPDEGSIKSTHGMKFWPLEPERLCSTVKTPEGHRRDIVFWDMGGQEEYRLVHQLFLHDTAVALVLLDPTRGASAYKEVETWNKYLEKQLHGRSAVKLLVGAKVDQPTAIIDHQALDKLCRDCGFVGYYETSAITGRGIEEFCLAVASAIDWDGLGLTSRPELFQRIRDEIEAHRKRGEVVLYLSDLYKAMIPGEIDQMVNKMTDFWVTHKVLTRSKTKSGKPAFIIEKKNLSRRWLVEAGTRIETALTMLDEIETKLEKGKYEIELEDLYIAALRKDVDTVTEQLATQGVIARSRIANDEPILVLQVQEIERYAGAVIVAARNNPRGVPALELRTIGQAEFVLPGIASAERLPRSQEKPVLECTVQLMLEHGICFQHEGLLIFPSLFAPSTETVNKTLENAASLYYDFAGAIDNIYASLIAWLVLAQDFGRVRLWADQAEFEVKDGGFCGLRKVSRPGGFAHVDVYFEKHTPERRREEFITFVEDHLSRNGVEIREHVTIQCSCGYQFEEDILRQRIARGEKDVACPLCETRHGLTEGAAQVHERDPKIKQHNWALRTELEKRRKQSTEQAVEALVKTPEVKSNRPIRLLHLSDLHFCRDTPIEPRLQWLLDDIQQDTGLGFKELDYLVISGDFTDKGHIEGFEKALEFVSGLTKAFALSAEQCIFVPGNHDIVDNLDAYSRRKDSYGLKEGEWFQEGKLVMARDSEKYPLRFKPFSDGFYHKFLQRPYPLGFTQQGMSIPFWETGVQFMALNSCWQIDEFHRTRASLLPDAVANAIREAQQQESAARKSGQLAADKKLLRIAVWHHAVTAPDYKMNDIEFVGNLQKNNVKFALHGDVHEMRRDLIGYWDVEKKLHIIGAGSFGARAKEKPDSTPRLYNLLEIDRDFISIRVHTRYQSKKDGPWDGWHEWPNPDGGKGRVPYYDIKLQ